MDDILARKNQTIVYIILACVIIALIGVATYFFLNMQKEKEERSIYQHRVEEADKLNARLKADITEEISARVSLEGLLDIAKAKSTELEDKINKQSETLDGLKKQFEQIEVDNKKLQDELKTTQAEKDKVAKVAKEHEFSARELEERIRTLENEKANLAKRLSQMKSVTLDTIEVKEKTKPKAYQTEAGKVLAINERFGFVIFNLGKDKGVEVGLPFLVYRGADLIARLKVEKVYERMSAGKILTEGALSEISINDQIEYGE